MKKKLFNNVILLIIILSIFSTIINDKYLWYYQGDEYTFTLFIKKYMDRDFLINDWHLNAEYSHFNIRWLYAVLISPIYNLLGDAVSSVLIYFLTSLLLFMSIFRISMILFNSINGSIIAVLVALISERLQTFVYGLISSSSAPFFIAIAI